jgi:hypothetical protein
MRPPENANAALAGDGAAVSSEDYHSFKPTEAKLQERHHEALVIMADWKDDILRKQRRMDLRAELVGIEPEEDEQLEAEVEQFKRCCRVLTCQPDEVAL